MDVLSKKCLGLRYPEPGLKSCAQMMERNGIFLLNFIPSQMKGNNPEVFGSVSSSYGLVPFTLYHLSPCDCLARHPMERNAPGLQVVAGTVLVLVLLLGVLYPYRLSQEKNRYKRQGADTC